jgi:hypothetical protein
MVIEVSSPSHNADGAGRVQTYCYGIAVNRAEGDRGDYALYPLRLQDRLPRFRIPLRIPDPDVVLDLQAVFMRRYDNGAYALLFDYAKPRAVPLTDEESRVAHAPIGD